jgi:hypothetical protein
VDSAGPAAAAETVAKSKRLDTLLPFSGVWVNAVYVQRICSNRSPRLDQNVAESSIIIPARTLQVTRMVGGFHDGGADRVVIKTGDHYRFYSADLSLPLDDILPVADTLMRIGDQTFVRLQHPDTTLADWGILEEMLFEGRYTDQYGKPVVFFADGHVSGFGSYRNFVPQIDYSEMSDPVDHIRLGRGSRDLDDFGFRFSGDSLILYSVHCIHADMGARECDSERLGERLYTLVKQRPAPPVNNPDRIESLR